MVLLCWKELFCTGWWTTQATNTKWKLKMLFSVWGFTLMFAVFFCLHHPFLFSLFFRFHSFLSHSLDSVPAVCVISFFSLCFISSRWSGFATKHFIPWEVQLSSFQGSLWFSFLLNLSLTLQLLGESSWSLSPIEALPASKITPIYYLFECWIRATVINDIFNSVLWLNDQQCPSHPVESSGEFFKALVFYDQPSKTHDWLQIIVKSHIFRSCFWLKINYQHYTIIFPFQSWILRVTFMHLKFPLKFPQCNWKNVYGTSFLRMSPLIDT